MSGNGCLVRVSGGSFFAWESTFSVGGKPANPVTAVRFEGGAGKTCRLRQCFARGAHLTALDLPMPGADVMIDGTLLVGGADPVLTVAGGATPDGATTLRVLRSTLIGRDKLIQLRTAPPPAGDPALHWMGWDVLLWRTGESSGGTMVDLPKDAGPKNITWHAVNSLYAGWETLLSGREPLAGSNEAAWHAAWSMTEGDIAQPNAWVRGLPLDPAEALPWAYHTYPGPVGFVATYGTGFLGCDLWQLPWVRNRWLDITTQRTRPTDVELLDPKGALPIPEPTDLLVYHGERLDLDKVDLGAYLKGVAKKQKLAPLVVMHLHGTGHRKFSPVRVENAHLFLYFEPPADGAEPLVLEPDPTVVPDGNALFEVTRGNLWMIGADVRCPDFKTALVPSYVVMVRDGNFFLERLAPAGADQPCTAQLLGPGPRRRDRQRPARRGLDRVDQPVHPGVRQDSAAPGSHRPARTISTSRWWSPRTGPSPSSSPCRRKRYPAMPRATARPARCTACSARRIPMSS